MPSVYTSAFFSLALLSLAAPQVAQAGIHVGDPVSNSARPDGSVAIFNWSLPVYELILSPCGGGNDTHQSVQYTISPTVGLTLPLGNWCEVTIVPGDAFTLTGLTPDSYDLDITLELGDITLPVGVGLNVISGTATETAFIQLLGVDWWDNQVAPYVGTGHAVTIDSGHARHAPLCSSIENASSLSIAPL